MTNKTKKLFRAALFLILVALIIAGELALSNYLNARQEDRLLARFKADPQYKQITDFIEKNRHDLATDLPRARLIGATMDMGLQWYNLHQYEPAARWWVKGLSIEPNNILGWYNLGNAYRELKKFSKAENAYRESMKRARVGETDACFGLGEMYKYLYTAKKDRESDVYLECLQRHKDNRDLIARLAGFYRDKGDIKNALLYFNKLWLIEPTAEVGQEIRDLQSRR